MNCSNEVLDLLIKTSVLFISTSRTGLIVEVTPCELARAGVDVEKFIDFIKWDISQIKDDDYDMAHLGNSDYDMTVESCNLAIEIYLDEMKEHGINTEKFVALIEDKMDDKIEEAKREYHDNLTQTTKTKRPKKCEGCGKNYADPPSKLCPGCQAYKEHQS